MTSIPQTKMTNKNILVAIAEVASNMTDFQNDTDRIMEIINLTGLPRVNQKSGIEVNSAELRAIFRLPTYTTRKVVLKAFNTYIQLHSKGKNGAYPTEELKTLLGLDLEKTRFSKNVVKKALFSSPLLTIKKRPKVEKKVVVEEEVVLTESKKTTSKKSKKTTSKKSKKTTSKKSKK